MAALPYDFDVLNTTGNSPPGDVPTGYNPTTARHQPDHAAGRPRSTRTLNARSTRSSAPRTARTWARSATRPWATVYPIPYGLRHLRRRQRPGLRRPGRQRLSRREPQQGRGRRDEPLQPRPLRPALRAERPGVALPEAGRRRRDATSRLSKLAPISFLNPADGLTRRRLFSTDAWDLNSFAYANDNPPPYAGAAYSRTIAQHGRRRHLHRQLRPRLHLQQPVRPQRQPEPGDHEPGRLRGNNANNGNHLYANFITTEFLPNPTLPPQSSFGNNIHTYIPNSSYIGDPSAVNPCRWPHHARATPTSSPTRSPTPRSTRPPT